MVKKFLAVLALLLASYVFAEQARIPLGRADNTEAGVSLFLSAEQGECPEDWRESLYLQRGKGAVRGCWIERNGLVLIFDEERDSGAIPKSAFKWARQL